MGMIFDGLAIIGCCRSGADAFPNEHTFVIPTTTGEPGGTGRATKAGDLCLLFDLANNSTTATPTLVTPTGFTSIISTTGSDALGNGARANLSYKILTAADLNVTITGMNGTENERKMVAVFQTNRPVQSVTAFDAGISTATSGDPANHTILVPGNNTSNVLVVGMACAESAITSLQAWTPGGGTPYVEAGNTTDELGEATATRAVYTYYPRGSTPAQHTFGIGDFSNFDTGVSAGICLQLT